MGGHQEWGTMNTIAFDSATLARESIEERASESVLRAVSTEAAQTLDRPRAERAITELLLALGRDPHNEHLAQTPRRVVDSFVELTHQTDFTPTTFPNEEGYNELVLVRDIPFHSLCEHHLLPFTGVAHVGYIPSDRIIGLSKLARVVEYFSRDLQVQERLTTQISNWLDEELAPHGVGVVLQAEHTCMTLRGIQARGSLTKTTSFTGLLAEAGPMREQFV